MSENILKPKLGFSTFQEGWVYKTFGEFVTNKSKKHNPKVSDTDYKCIELEHLESNTGRVLGFTSSKETNSTKNIFTKNQVLYGKLRPYLNKYYYSKFDGVCSSEIWVLNGINFSNEFLSHLTQTPYFKYVTLKTTGSKMPRADWNILSETEFCVPSSLPEQQKIADYLTTIDHKIELLQEKKTELTRYKKAMMQKLFAQEIRFKDENGNDYPEWEEKRLGEVTKKTDKKNKDNLQLPVFSISNKNGFVPQSEQFDKLDSIERGFDIKLYKIVDKDTFAYNPARINVGSIGYYSGSEPIIVSSLYVCFKTSNELSYKFLLNFLDTKSFSNQVFKYAEGGVRQYLFYENFSMIKLNLPSLTEQQKIADFLSAIDECITKVEEQIKETQNFKKAMLQQMFV